MGPNYACLFNLLDTLNTKSGNSLFVPQLHRRYVDDIVVAASCRRGELEALINFYPELQFTSTMSGIHIPFLDITLRISDARI